MNRRSGKVHWMMVVGLAGIVVILALVLLTGESPQIVASRFMAALAKGDAKTLAELSEIPGKSQDQIESDWKFATQVAGKYYSFKYKFLNQAEASPTTSSVRMQVWRNYLTGSSYEENFPLPMSKINGKWKVEVRGMSRKMYPGLPR